MAYAPDWVLAPTTLTRIYISSAKHSLALERIAQWLHPALFSDLDPTATFDTLLPTAPALSREGHFWGALNAQ